MAQSQQSSTNAGSFTKAAALLIGVLCLANLADARQLRQNKNALFEQANRHTGSPVVLEEKSPFRLEQDTSTYDDYVPLKVPFTLTDGYLKWDSFLIGLKLDDWYTNSTNCLNEFTWTIDDKDYFANNRTLYKQADESWINPWLNFTGLVGSHFASSLPYCYQFYTSVKTTETERFQSYSGWGDIMIAFLFNQMGNALEFQQKFTNIALDQETQNYQGVWMEYGDLVHIIWDFQQLEAGARDSLETMLSLYIPDMEVEDLDNETMITISALQRFADYIDSKAANITTKVNETVEVAKDGKKKALKAANQFNMPTDANRLFYGFLNGATDVFPYDSLPDLCRDNVTDTKQTAWDLFVLNRYVLPAENLEAITAFAQLLTYPYGLSFSCLFGAQQVFTVKRKVTDTTGMTEEEIFANELILVNDVITNFIFNLGYIYSDVAGYLTLDGKNLNYWSYAGAYAGDFVMRFWYRDSFSNEFQFDIIESCDTTDPDVTCLS